MPRIFAWLTALVLWMGSTTPSQAFLDRLFKGSKDEKTVPAKPEKAESAPARDSGDEEADEAASFAPATEAAKKKEPSPSPAKAPAKPETKDPAAQGKPAPAASSAPKAQTSKPAAETPSAAVETKDKAGKATEKKFKGVATEAKAGFTVDLPATWVVVTNLNSRFEAVSGSDAASRLRVVTEAGGPGFNVHQHLYTHLYGAQAAKDAGFADSWKQVRLGEAMGVLRVEAADHKKENAPWIVVDGHLGTNTKIRVEVSCPDGQFKDQRTTLLGVVNSIAWKP